MTNRFAWALTTVSLFGAFAMVAACSDDASTGKLPTSGSKDTGTVEQGTDGSVTPGTDSGTCKDTTPPKVRAALQGPFCPFSTAANDAGTSFKGTNCGLGETCCSATGSSGKTGSCAANGAACGFEVPTGGTRWECAGPEHCNVGTKCVLVHTTREGAKPLEIKTDLGCADTFQVAANTMGTICKADVEATEFEICSIPGTSASDAGTTSDAAKLFTPAANTGCSGGKTCVAFSTYGRDLGYCK